MFGFRQLKETIDGTEPALYRHIPQFNLHQQFTQKTTHTPQQDF